MNKVYDYLKKYTELLNGSDIDSDKYIKTTVTFPTSDMEENKKPKKEFKLKKYKYHCDGGSLKLITNKGVSISLINDIGDGSYTLYILRVPGWGPLHFQDKSQYDKYENFIDQDWVEYNISLGDKEDIKWKVLFYDLDNKFENDGIELKSHYIKCYHRLLTNENKEHELCYDSQILIICYDK